MTANALKIALIAWMLVSTGSSPSWTATKISPGTIIQEEGIFYSLSDHNDLIAKLMERRHRYEKAEAHILSLDSEIELLQHTIGLWDRRLQNCEIQVEIERNSCPTWLERKVGFCAGVGATIDTNGTVSTSAGVIYGFRF